MSTIQQLSRYIASFCVIFILVLNPAFATSQNNQHSKHQDGAVRINFNDHNRSYIINGEVTGMEVRDYILTAEKGQRLTLSVRHGQGPSIAEVIVYSVNGHPPQQRGLWEQTVLEESGEYLVRVLLPRAFARRQTKHTYNLVVMLEGKNGMDSK